jgi:hypothetical protein
LIFFKVAVEQKKKKRICLLIIIIVHFFTPILASSFAIRCFGCLVPSVDCTVPCSSPERCFIRGPTPYNRGSNN